MELYESVNTPTEKLNIPLSWHDDWELLYFKKGQYRLTLNMQEYDIDDECICFVNRGVIHKLESLDQNGIEYSLRFDLNKLRFREDDLIDEKLLKPLAEGKLCFLDRAGVSEFGFTQVLHAVSELIRRFHDFGVLQDSETPTSRRYVLKGIADELLLRGKLLSIIALIDACGMLRDEEITEADRQVKVIKDAIVYIQEHYKDKIYIRDLSSLSDLNEQYFIRFFGSVTGAPPLDYINRYRVEQASRLLRETDSKAYDIAKECGFHNIGNFIKIFRAVTGLTPHKYRKAYGRDDGEEE